MLRIKKEVDLKELEKFGFKFNDKDCEYHYFGRSWEKIGITEGSHIYFELMKTSIYGAIVEENLSVLFDLITAGYVEKVEA